MADNLAEDIREGAGTARMAEQLAARAKPDVPKDYDVDESELWEYRHFLLGEVISFRSVDDETGIDSAQGFNLVTKLAGAEDVGTRALLQKSYYSGKDRAYICYPQDGHCAEPGPEAFYIKYFTWYAAGTFKAP